jgi:hypothetical protein
MNDEFKICYICYSSNIDDHNICDRCDNYYCDDCSYIFTYHHQYEGSECHYCSEQQRKVPGNLKMIRRDNLINNIINGH